MQYSTTVTKIAALVIFLTFSFFQNLSKAQELNLFTPAVLPEINLQQDELDFVQRIADLPNVEEIQIVHFGNLPNI